MTELDRLLGTSFLEVVLIDTDIVFYIPHISIHPPYQYTGRRTHNRGKQVVNHHRIRFIHSSMIFYRYYYFDGFDRVVETTKYESAHVRGMFQVERFQGSGLKLYILAALSSIESLKYVYLKCHIESSTVLKESIFSCTTNYDVSLWPIQSTNIQ